MIDCSRIYFGGSWEDSAGEDLVDVVNPATEETVARVPAGSPADVDRAAKAAAAAADGWMNTSVEARADVIRALSQALKDRSDEITDVIVTDVGQPRASAVSGQTGTAIRDLDIMADCLSEITWAEQIGNTSVRRVPAGVVGAITPWNAPLKMICTKAGAAMAAGCTVVLKSSEVAPMSSVIFAEAAAKAGVPEGVFNLIAGTGPIVGEAIAAHPLIDVVSLTGSVRAGRRVQEIAAHRVKRVSLELGGKSAGIICEDADFATAVSEAIADAFRNSGQVCGGITRVLVPRKRLADAEELAKATAESFVLGDPFDPNTTLGPVATAGQRDRIRSYIQGGPDEGARLLTGGADAPDGLDRGYFVRPTVFSGDNSTRIAREEIFGPVVIIIPYHDEDDAIRIANDSDYGLAGAVWSGDTQRGRAVAARMRTGRVRINGAPLNPRAPHGGFKLSGTGREWGRFGIEEFLEYQSLIG